MLAQWKYVGVLWESPKPQQTKRFDPLMKADRHPVPQNTTLPYPFSRCAGDIDRHVQLSLPEKTVPLPLTRISHRVLLFYDGRRPYYLMASGL